MPGVIASGGQEERMGTNTDLAGQGGCRHAAVVPPPTTTTLYRSTHRSLGEERDHDGHAHGKRHDADEAEDPKHRLRAISL
jgi:hypothetical protein